MSMRVERGGNQHVLPSHSDCSNQGDNPESYPTSAPNVFDVLWAWWKGVSEPARSLEAEKKRFEPRWNAAGFVDKLEMVLNLRSEITLTNCQNVEAVTILKGFLTQPELEPVFKELGIDYEMLVLAIHDNNEAQSKVVVGKFRDHLDTYLTHALHKDLALLGVLQQAQLNYQAVRAAAIRDDIIRFNPELFVQVIGFEQALHDEQGLLTTRPTVEGFNHIGQDPLSAFARYTVSETIKALQS